MSATLDTSYLGLALRNPLVASPSPVTEELDSLRRLDDAGIKDALHMRGAQIGHDDWRDPGCA